ncbi:hypothetical protein AB0L00_13220 [Actinoallomurus sp. NPDC052308]|uniref:hypothetical protein n=1 Tax=Actinoallomurus sp. NPDC052308 TaxID=3155530 RepID=UPI003440A68A
MDELTVNTAELCAFHDETLHGAITAIEDVRRMLDDAHVPAEAYTVTEAGRVAHRGHTENQRALDGLLLDLHTLLGDSAQRVRLVTGDYRSAEDAAVRTVRRVSA